MQEEQRSVAELESRIDRQQKALLECELDGFYSPDVLATKRTELADSRADIAQRHLDIKRRLQAEAQREAMIASATRLYEVLHNQFETANYDVKARIYQLLIDRIVLTDDHAEVWLNLPDSASILPTAGLAMAIDSQDALMQRPSAMACVVEEDKLMPRSSGMERATKYNSASAQEQNVGGVPIGGQSGLIIFHAELTSSPRRLL